MRWPKTWVVALTAGLVVVCAAPCAADAGDPAGDNAASRALFSALLRDHVAEGRVDYPNLCDDERLEQYLSHLAATNPDTIADRMSTLAFWINAYNAYTLKIVCDNYPIDSINELHFGGHIVGTLLKKTVWDKQFALIHGEEMSLNHIEHEVIRKEFQDPRAHFALVCASRSCPPLRSEAYDGVRLDAQLDDQAAIFFGDAAKNSFDVRERNARLSRILDWFAGDFGENDEEILLFVSRFVPEPIAASLRADPDGWKIKHTEYDWSLNQ